MAWVACICLQRMCCLLHHVHIPVKGGPIPGRAWTQINDDVCNLWGPTHVCDALYRVLGVRQHDGLLVEQLDASFLRHVIAIHQLHVDGL